MTNLKRSRQQKQGRSLYTSSLYAAARSVHANDSWNRWCLPTEKVQEECSSAGDVPCSRADDSKSVVGSGCTTSWWVWNATLPDTTFASALHWLWFRSDGTVPSAAYGSLQVYYYCNMLIQLQICLWLANTLKLTSIPFGVSLSY